MKKLTAAELEQKQKEQLVNDYKHRFPKFVFEQQNSGSFNQLYHRNADQEFEKNLGSHVEKHRQEIQRFFTHSLDLQDGEQRALKEKYFKNFSSIFSTVISICDLYANTSDSEQFKNLITHPLIKEIIGNTSIDHFTEAHCYQLYKRIEGLISQYESLRQTMFLDLAGSFNFSEIPPELALQVSEFFPIETLKKISALSNQNYSYANDELLWKNKINDFFQTFKDTEEFKVLVEEDSDLPYKKIFYQLLAIFSQDQVLANLIIALQERRFDDVFKIIKEKNFDLKNENQLSYSFFTWTIILNRTEILPKMLYGKLSHQKRDEIFANDIKLAIKLGHKAIAFKIFYSIDAPNVGENVISFHNMMLSPLFYLAAIKNSEWIKFLVNDCYAQLSSEERSTQSNIFHFLAWKTDEAISSEEITKTFIEVEKFYVEKYEEEKEAVRTKKLSALRLKSVMTLIHQRNASGNSVLDIAAFNLNLPLMKYLITEKNIYPFTPNFFNGKHPFFQFMLGLNKQDIDSSLINECVKYFFSLNPTNADIEQLIDICDLIAPKDITPKMLEMQQAVLAYERNHNLPTFANRKVKHKYPEAYLKFKTPISKISLGLHLLNGTIFIVVAALTLISMFTPLNLLIIPPIVLLSIRLLQSTLAIYAIAQATRFFVMHYTFNKMSINRFESLTNFLPNLAKNIKSKVTDAFNWLREKVMQKNSYERLSNNEQEMIEVKVEKTDAINKDMDIKEDKQSIDSPTFTIQKLQESSSKTENKSDSDTEEMNSDEEALLSEYFSETTTSSYYLSTKKEPKQEELSTAEQNYKDVKNPLKLDLKIK